MAGHNNDDNKGKEGNKKLGILAGVVVAVLIVAAVLCVVLLRKPGAQEVPESSQPKAMGEGAVIDPNAAGEVTPPPSSDVGGEQDLEKYYYFVEMSTSDWMFESADEPSYNAAVSNSAVNSCNVFFDVTLDDTEEVVFVSPVIEPGNMVVDITLGKKLESGTYPATLVYHELDPETGEEFATVEIVISITIE